MYFRKVIISPIELKAIMNLTLDVNFKGSLMISLSEVLYRNQVHFKEFFYKVCRVGNLSLTELPCLTNVFQEFYSMTPVSMYFPKHSFLIENFNEKLMLFNSAGLIQYWASAHMDMKYLNFNTAVLGPKKINFQNLSAIFQIFLGGLMLSFAVFLGEILWKKIRRCRQIPSFANQQQLSA